MDADQAFATAQQVSSKLRSANNAFRTMPDDPEDLEEFYAFYDDPAEQQAVIARGRQATDGFLASFELVTGSPEAAQLFVREVRRELTTLCRTLQACDPSFDRSAIDAALGAAPRPTSRRDAIARVASPEARAAVTALFGFLARSKEERALLDAVSAKALDVTKRGASTEVAFQDTVVTCSRPGKPAASVPASYAAVGKVFGSVLWKHGGASIGYCGITRAGKLAEGSWEWQALEEGDNKALLEAVNKLGLQPRDIRCAFACGSNWILFDPTRKRTHEASTGEPAWAFVSHGDCNWTPMKSADALDASAVLLRLMAWSLAGTQGLLGEIHA